MHLRSSSIYSVPSLGFQIYPHLCRVFPSTLFYYYGSTPYGTCSPLPGPLPLVYQKSRFCMLQGPLQDPATSGPIFLLGADWVVCGGSDDIHTYIHSTKDPPETCRRISEVTPCLQFSLSNDVRVQRFMIASPEQKLTKRSAQDTFLSVYWKSSKWLWMWLASMVEYHCICTEKY